MLLRLNNCDIPYHAIAWVEYHDSTHATVFLQAMVRTQTTAIRPKSFSVVGEKEVAHLRKYMELAAGKVLLKIEDEE